MYVAEDFGASIYHFTDPDAFLSCDNPQCTQAWVTHAGLVVWALDEMRPSCSRFTDRVLVTCSEACVGAAMQAHGRGRYAWSAPMPVADWLDALRSSIELDPVTTPIGEFAGAA